MDTADFIRSSPPSRHVASRAEAPSEGAGRWTREFRDWLVAYMRGDVDARLGGQLDFAAQAAGEKARSVLAHRDRCPSCGRPYVDAHELACVLELADRDVPPLFLPTGARA